MARQTRTLNVGSLFFVVAVPIAAIALSIWLAVTGIHLMSDFNSFNDDFSIPAECSLNKSISPIFEDTNGYLRMIVLDVRVHVEDEYFYGVSPLYYPDPRLQIEATVEMLTGRYRYFVNAGKFKCLTNLKQATLPVLKIPPDYAKGEEMCESIIAVLIVTLMVVSVWVANRGTDTPCIDVMCDLEEEPVNETDEESASNSPANQSPANETNETDEENIELTLAQSSGPYSRVEQHEH